MGRNVIEYTDKGYINMRALLNKERLPYIWITGARGCGKTYGAIDYLLHRPCMPFILMRRTKTQAEFAGSIDATPLKKNLREGQELKDNPTKTKGLYRIDVLQDGELYNWVYVVGLSGVASMRGIDLTQCDFVLYDEFIKEPHERPIRSEFLAWSNAMETFGRNRSLEGLPPLRMIALSNALDLSNPYYEGLGIVDKVFRMTGDVWRDPSRGIAVYRPDSTEFINRKKQTSLYKLNNADETLGNDWPSLDLSYVKSMSLKAASPICRINDVIFFRVGGSVYASATARPAGVPAYDLTDAVDRAAVHRERQPVISALFHRNVWFEDVGTLLKCRRLIDDL